MNLLYLSNTVRKGSSNKTERNYFDFTISGRSLKEILGIESGDYITLLGWGTNEEYNLHVLNVFRLSEKSDIKSGRAMIYVCPECGGIDCGSITANIQEVDNKIIWKDFGYETDYEGLKENYDLIKPIEFEKQQYLSEFSKIK